MSEQLMKEFTTLLNGFYAAERRRDTTTGAAFKVAMDEWLGAIEALGVFIHAHPEFKQWDVRKGLP